MSKILKSTLVVAACAVLTVLAFDVALGRLVPSVPQEYETVEAIRDYAARDPQVLVLGSSYARSLLPVADWYRKRNPPTEIAVVPIEGGKFYAYDWLLQHRLHRLIDERRPDGSLRRGKLAELFLVVNYYDVCSSPEPLPNLPSRAWALRDYARDFAEHGVTAYNTNYVDQRWSENMRWSALVSDRGPFRIIRTLRERLSPRGAESIAATEQERLSAWVDMIGTHRLDLDTCKPDAEIAALDRMLAYAAGRGLRVRALIWPIIPKAQTPETLAVTERFEAFFAGRAATHHVEVIDLQAAGLLVDADFRPDLDHLVHSGEDKVLRWALAGPFEDLPTQLAEHAARSSTARANKP